MEIGNGNIPASTKMYSSKVVFSLASLVVILGITVVYLYLSQIQTKNTDGGIVQKQAVDEVSNNQESTVNNDKSLISSKDITFEAEKGDNYNQGEAGEAWSDAYKINVAGAEIGEIKQDGPFNIIRLAETSDKLFLTTEPVGIGGNYPRGATVYHNIYVIDLESKMFNKAYDSENNGSKNNVEAVSHDGKRALINISDEGLIMQVIDLSSQSDAINTFEISKEYTELGYAAFSLDDTKIIAEARLIEGSDDEKYASFGIDLNTGSKTQFNTYDEAKKWAGIN